MITDELKYRIRSAFGHVPTKEQEEAIDCFARFMTDRHEQGVMVLRGAAGTGKTSLSAAIVQALLSLQQKMVLLAPTDVQPRCSRSFPVRQPIPFIAAYTGRSRWTATST